MIFIRKGFISQDYYGNATPAYKAKGLISHGGIDWVVGYGKPVTCDNPGYVYKVIREGTTPSNWSAVYMIVEDTMEICYGHLSEIFVKEGDTIKADTVVGLEGNKGLVYSSGIEITPAMQKAGDKRGSHVHECWRPVKKVSKKVKGEYYLESRDGTAFYMDGYYQIINRDVNKGYIDPLAYEATKTIGLLTQLVGLYKKLITLKNGTPKK